MGSKLKLIAGEFTGSSNRLMVPLLDLLGYIERVVEKRLMFRRPPLARVEIFQLNQLRMKNFTLFSQQFFHS